MKLNQEKLNKVQKRIWAEKDIKYKLSLLKRFVLRIRGHVFLRYEKRKGWTGYLPIYLVKCKRHNCYFEDYPHGYYERFDCPYCLEERFQD
jgi:hypothetical protein